MSAPTEATNKSYLSDTLNAISPWSSRSTTPKGDPEKEPEKDHQRSKSGSMPSVQRGGDHRVSHIHRLSLKSYPKDCPKLDVMWYHAIDVAKRQPNYVHIQPKEGKGAPEPKKWKPFSNRDSRSLESAFQKYSDEEDRKELERSNSEEASSDLGAKAEPLALHKTAKNERNSKDRRESSMKVPVNEDYLFDVDIKRRELAPAYWLGPVYEVRRGTWFDSSTLKPCDENLATQLEEGYLRTQPWKLATQRERSASTTKKESGTSDPPADSTDDEKLDTTTSSASKEPASERPKSISRASTLDGSKGSKENKPVTAGPQTVLTHRLFGAYMNQVATYQDSNAAWVLSDDFLSRMSGAMFQRFIGGAGTKYIRGYSEVAKKKAPSREANKEANKDAKRPTTPPKSSTKPAANIPEISEPKDQDLSTDQGPHTPNETGENSLQHRLSHESDQEQRMRSIERTMSSLVSSTGPEDQQQRDEEQRQRNEEQMQEDYQDITGEAQDRDIEHLVLVTHGIGQRLGARFETFNFLHDVNELRKTLKTVYNSSPDLQALNSEVEKPQKNCRVQVLPIVWRHMLDFPQQGIRHNRKEHDIADVPSEEDDEYPSLDAITVEGVPALRNIVADLALDILLYQTPAYKDHISKIVVRECNRILKLFKKRNPSFNGKVSIVGHSLGSAVVFDILSDQQKEQPAFERTQKSQRQHELDMRLDFETQHFFCLGSPTGLFQMLKGRTIAGRSNPNKVTLDGYPDSLDDPFHDTPYSRLPGQAMTEAQREAMLSSPKCRNLYNIFHPSDPISYRLEPLISSAMTSLKPQALPYTKKNFFGAPIGQGFTGIPARVGQSFTGLWSNLSSSLTSSFINRSLGLSAEDAARLGAPAPTAAAQQANVQAAIRSSAQPKMGAGAGTNIVGGGVLTAEQAEELAIRASDERQSRVTQATEAASVESSARPPTLIDSEMETLFSGFQKRRKSEQENDANLREFGESPIWKEAEERGRKLRKEEAKVRALNSNGRVDYSIQEGAFDISFFAAVASHLAYWTDEDVCHFMLSQMLSHRKKVRASRSFETVGQAADQTV